VGGPFHREIREEALDEQTIRAYLGGYGLGARMLFDRQKAGVDPWGLRRRWVS
jgi:aldehyde:ferredoxin oxidoreductase